MVLNKYAGCTEDEYRRLTEAAPAAAEVAEVAAPKVAEPKAAEPEAEEPKPAEPMAAPHTSDK
jgi:hypothetical protein